MAFSSRLLLFDDNVCVGLFNSFHTKNKSTTKSGDNTANTTCSTSILLSATGDFLRVSRDNEAAVHHLTRFVPSRYAEQVQILLDFRNQHTSQPFLCERFSRKFEVPSGPSGARLCRLSRRLLTSASFEYYPDRLVDSGYRSASDLHTPLLAHLHRVYPAGLVGEELLRVGRAAEEHGSGRLASQAFGCSASDAGKSSALFDSMGTELVMLFSLDAYPAPMAERMLLIERVDACTCSVNRSAEEVHSQNTLEYDAWLDADEATCECVLTLRGDYVVLRCLGGEGTVEEHELHLTLLDFELEVHEPLAFGDIGGDSSPIDRLRDNRSHLLRLLRLREYVEQHCPTFAQRYLKCFDAVQPPSGASAEDNLPSSPISLAVDGIRYTALTRMENQALTVYSVHGMFPDHTMLEIDPRSGIVSAVLSGGETRTFDLAAFFGSTDKQAVSMSSSGQVNTEMPQGEPSEAVVRHIKSLLAFHRWAVTPAHLRPSLDEGDQRISALARASVLQSQRFILLQQLSAGQISYESAAKSSSVLNQGLQLAGRDLHDDDARFQLRHSIENEPLKKEKKVADSSTLENAIPVIVADPLQYRQQVQQRARAALNEANVFLDGSNAFLKSCLEI